MSQNNDSMPLTGVKVLDLSRVLAGPLCTMMLGDLGADVIKVERPGAGDETRGWGPPFDERGESAYFLSINRNKLGVTADLGSPEGRELVRRLIAGADVVVDNYRRGALASFGLDPDLIRDEHPRLTWLTISGFGEASDRAGYDVVVQAEQGWMAITGPVEGPPSKVGVALVDVVAGKDAAITILGALVGRARSGVGARLHVSLAASATAALVNVAQNALVSGRDAARWGNAHPNLVPYQLFERAPPPDDHRRRQRRAVARARARAGTRATRRRREPGDQRGAARQPRAGGEGDRRAGALASRGGVVVGARRGRGAVRRRAHGPRSVRQRRRLAADRSRAGGPPGAGEAPTAEAR